MLKLGQFASVEEASDGQFVTGVPAGLINRHSIHRRSQSGASDFANALMGIDKK